MKMITIARINLNKRLSILKIRRPLHLTRKRILVKKLKKRILVKIIGKIKFFVYNLLVLKIPTI